MIAALSAGELRTAYDKGELSPAEVVADVLEHIDDVNPHLTAFITVSHEEAVAHAEAAALQLLRHDRESTPPLLGIPVSVKDTIPTRGLRTTMGSLLRKDWIPDFEGPAVERLRRAGAIIIGKTNTSEFGWKGDAGNLLVGPTQNPWRLGLTAGGSSGGAAAAVASYMGPLAIGTDGGGSIRIPGSFCGVFAYKPSFGQIPLFPPTGLGTLSHIGLATRSVKDAALLLSVLAGADARDPFSIDTGYDDVGVEPYEIMSGIRVGWSPDLGWSPIAAEVAEVAARGIDCLADLGCDVVEVRPPLHNPMWIYETIVKSAQAAQHRTDLDDVRDHIDPGRLPLIAEGLELTAADLATAEAGRRAFYEDMRVFMDQFDLLVTPTVPVLPFEAGKDGPETINDTPVSSVFAWTVLNCPFNLTGLPAASVPCGLTEEGLPVGLQIAGPWRADQAVLKAAASYERQNPFPRLSPNEDYSLASGEAGF